MRKTLIYAGLLALALSSCAPSVVRAPERVYQAGAAQVYPEIVKLISTAEPLRFSKGWIITSSDRAGGFIAAQSSQVDLFGVPTGVSESLSVVISPKSKQQTAVVVQGTGGSKILASTILRSLNERFGIAGETTQVAENQSGKYTDAEGNVWLSNPNN